MNEEIAGGMVCFFHQKKHSYLIVLMTLLPTCYLLRCIFYKGGVVTRDRRIGSRTQSYE
jgi:hypothetical protein